MSETIEAQLKQMTAIADQHCANAVDYKIRLRKAEAVVDEVEKIFKGKIDLDDGKFQNDCANLLASIHQFRAGL